MISTEALYKKYLEHPHITTDTRKITKGAIFFALKGTNFNGNLFAAEALDKGAAYAIIDEASAKHNDRCLLVEDVLTSLQELARWHRRQLAIPIIGITGSNGKTTSKELIHAALSQSFNTFATHGNLNNHIGVPLSVLSIRKEHEMAIIEMGANHQKEIAFLCTISQPDWGLITNIGSAHLEGFGGPEGVKKGKKELYDYIQATNGKLFVNAADDLLMELSEGFERKTYGNREGADCQGTLLQASPSISLEWIDKNKEKQLVEATLFGEYNFINLMAAACIAQHFGVESKAINNALNSYVSENNRSQLLKTSANTIYLDAYNANPTSMKAAIENFQSMKADKKLLILGDMFELGSVSHEEHRNILEQAEKLNAQLILVGKHFYQHQNEKHRFFEEREAAKDYLKELAPKGFSILIKGSRGVALEKLLEVIP